MLTKGGYQTSSELLSTISPAKSGACLWRVSRKDELILPQEVPSPSPTKSLSSSAATFSMNDLVVEIGNVDQGASISLLLQ